MKQLFVVVCVLVLSAQSVVSSTQQASLKSQYSSFWEYLLEQEKTLTSFMEGKIWSDCSKLKYRSATRVVGGSILNMAGSGWFTTKAATIIV